MLCKSLKWASLAQHMTCARADDVTARAVSRLFSLVEFQRRVFWGEERSSRYFLYLHTHHTHFIQFD